MSEVHMESAFLKAVVTHANETFKAGYAEGYRAGHQAACAEFKKMLDASFPKTDEVNRERSI